MPAAAPRAVTTPQGSFALARVDLAVAGVAAAGPLAGRGPAWMVGTAILAAVVAAEHLYVAPRGELRPERINVAFFNYNAFASVAFALCALADLALSRGP